MIQSDCTACVGHDGHWIHSAIAPLKSHDAERRLGVRLRFTSVGSFAAQIATLWCTCAASRLCRCTDSAYNVRRGWRVNLKLLAGKVIG